MAQLKQRLAMDPIACSIPNPNDSLLKSETLKISPNEPKHSTAYFNGCIIHTNCMSEGSDIHQLPALEL